MKQIYKTYTLKINTLLLFTLLTVNVFAQTQKLTGLVQSNNENILGATVRTNDGISQSTDTQGAYTIDITANTKSITVSYVGYKSVTKNITEAINNVLNFDLDATSLDEVVVVGSRAVPRSNLETPAPVDVIDIKNLTKDVAQVSLNQLLNYVAPSFNSNTQVISDGTDHIDPASLRGLGPDQVLVLINGKRRHTTSVVNINGTFGKGSVGTDLNAIPTAAIKRIEILRDGAAAQYGSDAIAGVINIILEDNVQELRASATYGGFASENAENKFDGQSVQANLNFGLPLGDRGGYINFSGSYDFREPTNRQKEFTGVIFNDYNNPTDYPSPTGANITDAELAKRGLTRADFVSRIGQAQTRGGALFFNSAIPLRENAEFYAFGGLNYRNGESAAFRRQPAQLTQNISEIYPLGFLPLIVTDNYDQSFATGIKGKIGNWNADFSNSFGRNAIDFKTENSLNASLLKASPTSFDDGGYRFAQNTTNFDVNRFFEQTLAGINVAFGLEHRYENYKIVAGEEASYADYGKAIRVGTDGAGNPILIPNFQGNVQTRFAANGSAYASGAQAFGGFRPDNAINESRSSIAAYGDVEVNFTPSFLLTGALRFENYSDFGSTLNWKISTRYKIDERFNFRAAASSGFRAPSLHQRYFNATSSLFVDGQIINSGTFTNDSRPAQLLGIPSLKQETSHSYSAGLTGNFGKLKATIDGYYIRINDRIVYTGNFTGSNAAGASEQDKEIYSLLQTANASSARFFANAIDTETKGLDVVLTYNENIGKGTLRTDLSGTFVKTNILGEVKSSEKLAGKENIYFDQASRIYLESAVPRQKINLSFNYTLDKFNVFLRNVYFGEVEGATNVDADRQTFGGKVVTDLSLGYQLTKNLKWTVGANNLFDVYPDKVRDGSSLQGAGYFLYSRTGQQFGFNGRFAFTRLALTL
ncbi:MAG TPA: TonB-dependent receptor [Sphingobacterium bovisgrunnientis]|jgi:iron complex outermembrane receptor protein|uniref:TonB-dependent receptor n=1 Tax=Sphingobacterium bovisgrunnientis TaxID=1874697 RepID=UPI00135C9532|nr:TonB-dependent receptor [Sphingobacterium bovisgrunnientis]HLS36736.1 TonB-dependent receptor [Sphingobacterium bovisgrunnientis]